MKLVKLREGLDFEAFAKKYKMKLKPMVYYNDDYYGFVQEGEAKNASPYIIVDVKTNYVYLYAGSTFWCRCLDWRIYEMIKNGDIIMEENNDERN